MSHTGHPDPSFLLRCRLWTALVQLVPEADRDEAERYCAQLDVEYLGMVAKNVELVNAARQERDEIRAELQDVQRLAGAAVTVTH